MLEKLPNEILVQILNKCNSKTVEECRLLKSRFDKSIQTFLLHRKISRLRFDFGTENYRCLVRKIRGETEFEINLSYLYLNHLDPQDVFPKFLEHVLKKFRSIDELHFGLIRITDDTLNVILESRIFRTVKQIFFNSVMEVSNKKFEEIVSKMNLSALMVSTPPISKTIFVHVNRDSALCFADKCNCIRRDLLPPIFKISSHFRAYIKYLGEASRRAYSEVDKYEQIFQDSKSTDMPQSVRNLIHFNFKDLQPDSDEYVSDPFQSIESQLNVTWLNESLGVTENLQMNLLNKKFVRVTLTTENWINPK